MVYWALNTSILKDNEVKLASLIWTEPRSRYGAIYVYQKEFVTIDPMKWIPQTRIAQVGTKTTYSGYPSSHQINDF